MNDAVAVTGTENSEVVGAAGHVGKEIGHLDAAFAVAGEASRPLYDPATEIDVSGSVTRVREVARGGGSVGLHVDLAAADLSYDVHLGPKFFLDEIGLVPAVGDPLDVVGSRRGGNPAVLIAREVTRGERTWTLRDPSGRPLWRGRGPR